MEDESKKLKPEELSKMFTCSYGGGLPLAAGCPIQDFCFNGAGKDIVSCTETWKKYLEMQDAGLI